jgi:hypothetical protein
MIDEKVEKLIVQLGTLNISFLSFRFKQKSELLDEKY